MWAWIERMDWLRWDFIRNIWVEGWSSGWPRRKKRVSNVFNVGICSAQCQLCKQLVFKSILNLCNSCQLVQHLQASSIDHCIKEETVFQSNSQVMERAKLFIWISDSHFGLLPLIMLLTLTWDICGMVCNGSTLNLLKLQRWPLTMFMRSPSSNLTMFTPRSSKLWSDQSSLPRSKQKDLQAIHSPTLYKNGDQLIILES